MAATLQIQGGTGATVSWANAEGGIKFSRDDAISASSPTPVPIPVGAPSGTGTNYSWIKNLVLAVTATSTTNISNRRLYLSAATPTGAALYFKNVAVASYAQAASGNMPAASGSNLVSGGSPASPSGYTLVTSTALAGAQVWDATSVASSSSGPNGAMCVMVLGVDGGYAGGAGSASLGTLFMAYDEA